MTSKPLNLVCAFDPLCGWCFGFNPVLKKLRSKLGDQAKWRIMSGGLVTGERERPIGEMAGYLRSGLEAVYARTGQRAGDAFYTLMEEGSWVSRSEPACRAIFVVQQKWPDKAIEFAQNLCNAFYVQGLAPTEAETLVDVATSCNIPAETLIALWAEESAKQQTSAEFAKAKSMGVTGYPALYLANETWGGLQEIMNGCGTYEDAEAGLNRLTG